MPSLMSSLKKRITLATLLNKNTLPMCCSSVTEDGREEEIVKYNVGKAFPQLAKHFNFVTPQKMTKITFIIAGLLIGDTLDHKFPFSWIIQNSAGQTTTESLLWSCWCGWSLHNNLRQWALKCLVWSTSAVSGTLSELHHLKKKPSRTQHK